MGLTVEMFLFGIGIRGKTRVFWEMLCSDKTREETATARLTLVANLDGESFALLLLLLLLLLKLGADLEKIFNPCIDGLRMGL